MIGTTVELPYWLAVVILASVVARLAPAVVISPVKAGIWAAWRVPTAPVDRLIGVAEKAPVALL